MRRLFSHIGSLFARSIAFTPKPACAGTEPESNLLDFHLSPHLLNLLIEHQATTQPRAVAECVMNSVDAGATRIDITLDTDLGRRITAIDGRGLTTRQDVEHYRKRSPRRRGSGSGSTLSRRQVASRCRSTVRSTGRGHGSGCRCTRCRLGTCTGGSRGRTSRWPPIWRWLSTWRRCPGSCCATSAEVKCRRSVMEIMRWWSADRWMTGGMWESGAFPTVHKSFCFDHNMI